MNHFSHTDYKVNLNDAISLGSVTTGNTVMNTNGVTIGSGSTAVSLTSAGLNNGGNTITNVKAGTNGTDAVNVSQMNAATAGSKTTVSNGTNTTVSSSTAADGHTNYQVNLNDAISLGSVTTGNTVMNTNGVTIGSGSTAVSLTSTGLNNGGNKITNVAAGTADTDAVNKGQMTNAIDESMKYFKANSTGTEASATGSDAVAVGSGAVSGGSEAVALGLNTAADGDQSLALGVNAGTSSGTTGAIAVGNTAKASQNGAVAIGQNSAANGKRSTVVGDSAQAVGDQALALGASASASGTNGTALGTSASTAGSSATAVGSHASAAGGSAAAIGDSASASGGDSVALGASSQASGTNDISLGASAGVGTQSGSTSKTQQNRISIGANAGQNGSGNENTAIGLNAGDNVSGNFNVAMGSSAGGATSGDDNTAIGYEANKNGSGSHSTAVGASTTASSAATALGYKAAAVGNNSVAVGYAAQANGSSGVAVGDGAKAADNSIALGHNSAASRSDSSGNAYLTGQAAGIYGVVSVGSSEGDITFQRRIINVADGSNGTDAVNVNQLKAAQTSVATLIGGGVTLNTDGSYGQFSLTDKNGTVHSYDTLAAALGAVTSDQIQVATADAVTYTDGNKTNINANGTISKVTAATSSDQAVNLGQMNSAIAASQTKYYSVNSNESDNQDNTGATGENAIAAGPAATAVGDRSISIGDNTKAQGTNSIAIGNSNTTSDRQATAYGQSSIAIGSSASSAGNNSIALGNYALTEVQNSTSTTVNSAIAIGDQAQATSDQAVALGKNAHASGVNAFAQGNTSSATNESSIAVGTNASSSGTASTVIGKNSAVSGTHSGLIGTSMSTDTNQTGQALTGSDTYVVGNGNGTVGGTNSSIMGNSNTVGTTVTDPNGITHSYNTVNTSILGNSNTVTAQDADVIGHDNTVGKKNLNAAGIADGTIDTAAGSGVFGGNNTVYGSGNRIIGNNNTDSNLDGVFILGNNVTAGLADSVYLGNNSAYVIGSDASSSTTAGVNSYSSVTIGSGNYTFAGANAAGVVTVGSVGSERRIQNVSAGLVSSTSTDAVNGSQLYTLTQPLRFAGDNSTVGSYSNAGALDKNVIQRSSDQALKITGGANLNNLSSNNIGVVASTDTNTLTVQLAKDLTGLNSVTTGNTVMNTNGVTIGSGSSAVSLTNNGLSNGNNTITNVKAGVNGTDAVNVSQLNTAAAKATTTVSNGTNTTVSSTTATDGHTNYQVNLNDKITLGSGANAVTVDGTAGAVTAGAKVSLDGVNGRGTVGNVTINGSGTTGTVNGLTNKTWDPNNYVSGQAATEDQLKLAVNTSNTTVTNAGLNFAGNDGTVIHKNLGDQLNIVGGYTGNGTTSSKNIKTVKNQSGNLEIQMADDAVFNSLTTGNTVMNNSGITIGSGSSAVSLTNTGLNNGGQKITNVAAGTVSATSTDAVNGSQLNTAAIKATTTVSDGTNTHVTSSTAIDGHTDYQVNLNDTVTLGSGADAVTLDGTKGTVTAGTGDNAVTVNGTNGTIQAGTKVSLDGVNGSGTIGNVIVNGSGSTGTVNGLTNKTWDPNNYVSGQAATEDQLKQVGTTLSSAGLNFVGNDGQSIHKDLGSTLNVVGGYTGTGSTSAGNIKTVKNTDGDLEIQMADDAVFNSVTTGNTILNSSGVTIGSGDATVSLTDAGLNNGGNKITNVAAGTADTDGVNVSQLNQSAAAAKTTVSQGKNITVTETPEEDGHTDYSVALNDAVTLGSGNTAVFLDGTAGTITAGIGSNAVSLNGTNGTITSGLVTVNGSAGTVNGLTNKTWDPDDYVSGQAATEDQLQLATAGVKESGLDFSGNDGAIIHKNLGEQLNIVGGYTGSGTTSSKNIKTVKNTDGDLEIQMADDAVFNSVTTGNTILNSSGVTIGSGDATVSLTDAGLNNGGNKITNVAAGTADTDGVNVSQLNQSAAAAKTTVSQGKNITITETPEEDGHTDYNVALNDIITLGTGTSAVTIDGIAGTVATGNTTIYGDKIITGATTITDLGLITAGTGDYAVKIDGTAGTISAGTKVSFDGTQGTGTIGKVIINGSGTTGTINGLTNKTWDPNNYTSGQAATEDQLSAATNNLINAGLTFAGNTGSIQKKLGDTMNIVGGYNGSGTTSGNNIKTVVNSNGDMEIQMADDASFNSVTTGNTVMNTNGVTTTDTNGNTTSVTGSGVTTTDTAGHTTSVTAEGVTAVDADGNSSALSSTGLTTTDAAGNTTSVTGNGMTITGENGKNVSLTSNGLDNGGNKITNVAAGTADTDAVNVSQLNAAAAAAKTTVSQGKNITVTSVQKDDGHTDYNVALNDTITLGSGTNAVTVDGTTGAVTTGNTAIYGDKIVTGATTITDQGVITAGTGDNAVKIDGTAGTISAGTKVSFDGTQGTGTIGNVTINGNGSTGTVNGLTNKTWEPDNYVSGQAASEDQLKVLDDRTVQYDRNEDGTVNKGQITLAGDGGTKITNVTAGTLSSDSTDAVNGSQLYATNQAVINNSQSINILGNSINKLDNRVNKVGAGAAALAALHPLDFDPDNKWDFAAGFGNYRDATAVAVGAFYRPNEDTMFSVGGNFGNGENMVNAGVSFKLGQGNHVSTSRVAMAKELKDVRAVVAQQAEQIQQLAAMVNSLVGVQAVKPDTTVMFPDVPKNHWAYETIKAMAAQGLIEGYPDGTFGGDRTMTRYEFAQIIYRVIQKGIAVDSKLIGEFKPELERIRVDTITRDKNGNPTIERVRVNK